LRECRGRAEFQRAETYFQSGAYRQAYLSYWEAYQLHPSEDFLLALRKAGRRVAEDEQAKARRAEAQGRMDEALDGYELALEYDASSPATLDSYHRLSDRREAIAALRGIDRAGEGQGEAASDWEPARRVEELARQEPGTSDLERNLREAIAAASGARLSRLREVTLEQPLSSDRKTWLAYPQRGTRPSPRSRRTWLGRRTGYSRTTRASGSLRPGEPIAPLCWGRCARRAPP
jgi:tetratricopeptide (TPR) repeat protein